MPSPLLPESSATVTVLSASATGASFTGVTFNVTVWLSLPPLPLTVPLSIGHLYHPLEDLAEGLQERERFICLKTQM